MQPFVQRCITVALRNTRADGKVDAGAIDMAAPLREFPLTEDLNTRWLTPERFLVPAMTFLARTLGDPL